MFRRLKRNPLRLLNAVFAVSILAVALLYIAIARQLTSTDRDPANHIQWAAYQIQAEFLKTVVMAERVAHGELESVDALALRFDILVSRIGVLRGPEFEDYFQGYAEYQAAVTQLDHAVRVIDSVLAAVVTNPPFRARLVLEHIRPIEAALQQLTQASIKIATQAKLDQRTRMYDQYRWQIGASAVAVAAILSLAVLLDRLLRRERRSRVYFARLSRQLSRARDEATAAARAKAEFLASMSHEIRTPMNGIIATTELLESSKLNTQQLAHAQTIRRSGEALLAIINDVLDFSRIEAGKMQLASAIFDPVGAAEAVIQLLRPLGQQKGLEVGLSVAQATPRVALGDETRLRQVLMNLVGNAIKFTERGSVRVEIAPVASTADEIRIRFDVVDSGIGIGPEDLTRLFDRFSAKVDAGQSRFGSTGLGLSISKRIVELMGGTIEVESRLGQGSRFSVVVGAGAVHGIAMVPAARDGDPAPQSDSAVPARALRILVVEDNETNQVVVRQIIEKAGHSVEIVGDGASAVKTVREQAFDVILLDLHLPDMSGFVVASAIRALPAPQRDTPIVAVTADVMGDVAQRCRAAGMDGYLAKPYRVRDMSALLARWASVSGSVDTLPHAAPIGEGELDHELLEELVEHTGAEAVAEMIEDFASRLQERRATLLVNRGNLVVMAQRAHSLAGAGAAIGLLRFADLCRSLEHAAMRRDATETDRLLTEFPAASDQTHRTLSAYRVKLRFGQAEVRRSAP